MFRSFIYLDEDKLYAYKKLIDNGIVHPSSISSKKTKSASAGTKNASVSYVNEEETVIDVEKDPFGDYDRFELALAELEGEDFFDLVMNEDQYHLLSMPQMKIIKLMGTIEVPEEFDLLNLIESYKPLLIESMIGNDADDGTLFAKAVFSNTTADIPIVVDYGDVTVVGRLNTKWLCEDYTALEEYSEQEVVLLCKVIGINSRDRVTIFNPLKDFIKLNRAMRRSGTFESGQGFDPITVSGPVIKVEFIALYK